MAALILNIIRGGYDPLPNDESRCSDSLKGLVNKMLQRDFNDRPTTKEILNTQMVQHEMDRMGITPPTPSRRKRAEPAVINEANPTNECIVESEDSDDDIAPPSYSPPQELAKPRHNTIQATGAKFFRPYTRAERCNRSRDDATKVTGTKNALNDDPELSRSTNIRNRLESNKKAFQREAIRKGLQVLESRGSSRKNTPQKPNVSNSSFLHPSYF